MVQTILGAIIGIITSYVFHIIARTRSRLNYQTSRLQIIGNIELKLPQEFEVTMAGVRINSLQKSQIVIWNGGTTTITGESIVKDDHLRIVFSPGTKIFNFTITGLSRKVNKFTVKNFGNMTENELFISFDFLDKKDGVMIEVLHTESVLEPKIEGTIKGLKNGIRNKGQINYLDDRMEKSWWKKVLIYWGGPLLITLITGTVLYLMLIVSAKNIEEQPGMTYLTFLLGTYISFLFIINGVNFFNKRKFPKSIKNFQDIVEK